MILSEEPMFIIHKPHELINESDILTAFGKLEPGAKHQILQLRNNAGAPFTLWNSMLAENSFALPRKTGPAYGLYLLASRFNHSCVPNTKVPEPAMGAVEIAMYATRDITMDEEITFCYNSGFEALTRTERHRALRFVCECKACRPGTQFAELSDMRRTLIRGLQYLTLGGDDELCMPPGYDARTPHIISDPGLRRAAEEFRIPLTSRFVYDVFTMLLLEEGLLDEFMRERIEPGVVRLVGLFGTEGNARVARRAVGEETVQGKVGVALGMWGRRDKVDDVLPGLLKVVRNSSKA
jgi:hypothetical protein